MHRDGAPETNRTSDLPLRRGLLYPLSYRGASWGFYRIGRGGLDLRTETMPAKRTMLQEAEGLDCATEGRTAVVSGRGAGRGEASREHPSQGRTQAG